ncbi:MAG: ChaN family lipoprotein [Desulfocapsaceae bacterium]|nr:ChaN family lipoprotein [Desulfocapsaceae bacterium]
MSSSFNTSPPSLSLFLLTSLPLFFLLLASPAAASISSYELAISFQPEKQMMSGTAHISVPAGQELSLGLEGISASAIMINTMGQETIPVPIPNDGHLHFPATNKPLEVFISYCKQIPDNDSDNMISDQGIILSSMWHPIPDRNMRFRLRAMVPKGFKAIAESDDLGYTARDKEHSFSFSQPVQSIHFAAGPYSIKTLKIRKDLLVSTWFFKEDASLSHEYLEAAAKYIRRYEQEIGTFPYHHYAIIANRLPSGWGMPTFTLLGQQVLRLPFIKDTSLGHEILHSWFGNSIEVRPDSGNWCEGLTSYLADYAYDEEQGHGVAHRKEAIINYLSYVSPKTAISLGDFVSADHNQPMAQAIRAVGYNRGAMFFHELKGLLGPELFREGVRQFYQKYRGQAVSWDEIRESFEQVAKQDLHAFFQERLESPDIPDLTVSNIKVDNRKPQTMLTFTLRQQSKKPFTLILPILVKTPQGEQRFSRTLSQTESTIKLPVDGPPTELIIDPDYDLLRVLTPKELPPVWSRFLGAPEKTIVLESKAAATIFAPLLQDLAKPSWKIMAADQVRNQDLSKGSTLFLGVNGSASRSLFARPDHPQQGFTVDVRTNPLNQTQVTVLMSSSSAAETSAALPKLSHYGKYSWLHFRQGQIQEKTIKASESGIHFILEELPSGSPVSLLSSFDTIIDQLSQRRVIYVGENHTSMADHRLQFRIIQALHQKNPDLAIGMEMFPQSSQVALDAYINDDTISEREFLRASRYFEVWSYDWRYFRDIINYARIYKLPVIGLNLERKIVSKVFADGNTDSLNAEQKMALPEDRNLDLPGYTERLDVVHGLHSQNQQEGKGMLAGFIQAQAIWDETMAERTATFLTDHPTTRMVILAGAQHTRKDSGIPPRVASRIEVRQASVVNLSAGDTGEDLHQTTDFFFLAAPVDLEPVGKMGLMLAEMQEGGKKGLKINDISPLGKASQAGVLKNDILIAINNTTISSMEDVRIILMDKQAGEHVKVRIQRQDGQQTEEKEVELELSNLEMPKSHP